MRVLGFYLDLHTSSFLAAPAGLGQVFTDDDGNMHNNINSICTSIQGLYGAQKSTINVW